jgi:outer membrane biosynthesis protein TonB
MLSNRIFQVTFLISIITHGIILLQNPNFTLFGSIKKDSSAQQVIYIKSLPKEKSDPKIQFAKNEPFLKLTPAASINNRIPLPYTTKNKPLFSKPVFPAADIIAVKKKITLPELAVDPDKINNPSYIGYYQIVREKIRRAAYQNYTGEETGEVFVSFVISSDGSLQEFRITEEKSAPSPYLRKVALNSLQEASGFPRFPGALDYPCLSFNVMISFQIE